MKKISLKDKSIVGMQQEGNLSILSPNEFIIPNTYNDAPKMMDFFVAYCFQPRRSGCIKNQIHINNFHTSAFQNSSSGLFPSAGELWRTIPRVWNFNFP